MTELLILNIGLFLPIAFGGLAASWFGWKLAGSDSDSGGGGSKIENGPLTPRWPSPVRPRDAVGPRDLALGVIAAATSVTAARPPAATTGS